MSESVLKDYAVKSNLLKLADNFGIEHCPVIANHIYSRMTSEARTTLGGRYYDWSTLL